MENKTYMEVKERLLNDPTVHDSLKDMINMLDNKDIVDNYYDVKILLNLCILRLNENKFNKKFNDLSSIQKSIVIQGGIK